MYCAGLNESNQLKKMSSKQTLQKTIKKKRLSEKVKGSKAIKVHSKEELPPFTVKWSPAETEPFNRDVFQQQYENTYTKFFKIPIQFNQLDTLDTVISKLDSPDLVAWSEPILTIQYTIDYRHDDLYKTSVLYKSRKGFFTVKDLCALILTFYNEPFSKQEVEEFKQLYQEYHCKPGDITCSEVGASWLITSQMDQDVANKFCNGEVKRGKYHKYDIDGIHLEYRHDPVNPSQSRWFLSV